MSDILIPDLSGFEWGDVRRGIGRCIEAVCPKAKVHTEWKVEFDPNTSVGKYVGQILNGLDDHSGFVHAWMIGLMNKTPITSGTGFDNTIGGATSEYNLTFAVWGFFDYKSWRVAFGSNTVIGDDGSQRNATAYSEYEIRALTAVFRRNATLGLDSGRVRCTYPHTLENTDNHPFSNGKQIIVAQTTLGVRVRESFT